MNTNDPPSYKSVISEVSDSNEDHSIPIKTLKYFVTKETLFTKYFKKSKYILALSDESRVAGTMTVPIFTKSIFNFY